MAPQLDPCHQSKTEPWARSEQLLSIRSSALFINHLWKLKANQSQREDGHNNVKNATCRTDKCSYCGGEGYQSSCQQSHRSPLTLQTLPVRLNWASIWPIDENQYLLKYWNQCQRQRFNGRAQIKTSKGKQHWTGILKVKPKIC